MSELKMFVVIVDRCEAYLVKDLSVDKAMKRILSSITVTGSLKAMSVDNAMKKMSYNILQIHSDEVSNLVL